VDCQYPVYPGCLAQVTCKARAARVEQSRAPLSLTFELSVCDEHAGSLREHDERIEIEPLPSEGS
jgi:hypothetical protein